MDGQRQSAFLAAEFLPTVPNHSSHESDLQDLTCDLGRTKPGGERGAGGNCRQTLQGEIFEENAVNFPTSTESSKELSVVEPSSTYFGDDPV